MENLILGTLSAQDVIVTPVEEVEEIENIEDIENAESREVG